MLPDDLVAAQVKAQTLEYGGTGLSFDYSDWKKRKVCGYYVIVYGWDDDANMMTRVRVPLGELVEAVFVMEENKAQQEHDP